MKTVILDSNKYMQKIKQNNVMNRRRNEFSPGGLEGNFEVMTFDFFTQKTIVSTQAVEVP